MSLKPTIVDTAKKVEAMLKALCKLPTQPPSIFIHLEGIRVSRHGSISILSIYADPIDKVWQVRWDKVLLVDVYKLAHTVFDTARCRCAISLNPHHLFEVSLRSILESAQIPKVIFDVRKASDVLFNNYHIALKGVIDLQLMELASRKGSREQLSELAQCIEQYKLQSGVKSVIEEWQYRKSHDIHLTGGRYEVCDERPMRHEIAQYCANDVIAMKNLYDAYDANLCKFWRTMVREGTAARIEATQHPLYDVQTRDDTRGPWDDEYIEEHMEHWNQTIWDNGIFEEGVAGDLYTHNWVKNMKPAYPTEMTTVVDPPKSPNSPKKKSTKEKK